MISFPLYVTIDTNIFYECKFDFKKDSTLDLLVRYAKQGKIKVVLSDIVIRETKGHIQNIAKDLYHTVNTCRKDLMKITSPSFINASGLENFIDKKNLDNIKTCFLKVFEKYLIVLEPEIIETGFMDVSTIFEKYFSTTFPFENKDKKRKEFPDAFIVEQIKNRFKNETVAIVSKDQGFIKSFEKKDNFVFFNSLGELYNEINKQEKDYSEAYNEVSSLHQEIIAKLIQTILKGNNIDVIGISYDKFGVRTGYDYDDFEVVRVSNMKFKIHSIDEITNNSILATLNFRANIEVICSYDDYNTAIWDSDSKEYLYIETKRNIEMHNSNFNCIVKIDKSNSAFELQQYRIILNSDTRKIRVEMEDDSLFDEQDILNQDRENLTFISLDRYDEYLENDLINCKMQKELIDLFKEINDIINDYGEISSAYDTISDVCLKKPKEYKNKLLTFTKNIKGSFAFPISESINEITNKDIETINRWANDNYKRTSTIVDQNKLPDYIEYGNKVYFSDTIDNKYCFSIGDLSEIKLNSLSEGDEKYINLLLENEYKEIISEGIIKLTVGYLNFDEDENAADGIQDCIEYSYEDIISAIENIIIRMKNKLNEEQKIIKLVDFVFN